MNDLISRQAAIDAIESHIRTAEEPYQLTRADEILNHAFEISASCVYNLPSAEPEPSQWIPASERLPEEGERAILRYSNGKISGGTYIGSRVFDVDFGDTDPAVSVVEWRPE